MKDNSRPITEHEHSAAERQDFSAHETSGDDRTVLRIAGMDCAEEVAVLEKTLKPIAGVRGVEANLLAAKITVSHDERVTPEQLIAAIKPTGMSARLAGRGERSSSEGSAQRSRAIAVGTSGALTGFGLIVHSLELGPEWPHVALFVGAIVSGGWFIFPKAVAAVRRLSPDMNVLMTVAVIGAAMIGEWSEGAAVTFLFALSELLEAFSVRRARRAIESLLELSPETALVKKDGAFQEVPVEEVNVGDVIAVRSGSRIPLDGEVIAGESTVNQAPITGESMPVEKKQGDTVFAGTINGEGSLEVRVTKPSTDTTLAKIIHLVEEAQSQKAPSQRFVDVFAKYYTPAVMVLALLVLLVPPLFLRRRMAHVDLSRARSARHRLPVRARHFHAGLDCLRPHRDGAARRAHQRRRVSRSDRQTARARGG